MKCMNACMKGCLALLIFMMGSFEDILTCLSITYGPMGNKRVQMTQVTQPLLNTRLYITFCHTDILLLRLFALVDCLACLILTIKLHQD
jgi:hypothetical protein